MSEDLISRQAAIGYISRAIPNWSEDKETALDCLENMPSAQPIAKDTISRQAAIEAIDEYIENNRRPDFIGNMVWVSGVADAMRIVSELPSVQERKKGHDTGLSRWFHCSECGYGVFDVYLDDEQKYDLEYHYCPNCGAKMDGGEE